MTQRQRKAIRLIDESEANAVWVDRHLGYIWKDDVRRDPYYADAVICAAERSGRAER